MQLPPLFLTLEEKEREYFFSLAKQHERELALHENPGKLWEKDATGRDWSNVTEHCLVEVARVAALSGLLGLSEKIQEQLISAAAIHDFNKREEVRFTREDISAGGSGRKGVLVAEEKSGEILRDKGFSPFVVSLATHVTGDINDTSFIKEILDADSISEEGRAHLVMHYVDGYTRGSAWVEPADHQKRVNDIDRRNEMNANNLDYKKMNQEGLTLNVVHPFFHGKTRFEAAASLGHLVEKRFFEIMKKRGIAINDPLDIPEVVDMRVRSDIEKKRGL